MKLKKLGILVFLLLGTSLVNFAQEARKTPTPKMVYQKENKTMPVATGNNLYCAGYIQTTTFNTNLEIVGGSDEAEQYSYAQGDYVYIGAGNNQGVKVGDLYSVIRPRGKFKSVFSNKGNLGVYVQEVGALEVVSVKNEFSVAFVKNSCDVILLGDILQPIARRVSPKARTTALNQFSNSSGKTMGRIVLARDGQEYVTRDQIVFIDLGAEDNVSVGDYLTVFRPLGKRNIIPFYEDESTSATDSGFESERYKGGKYSNQTGRKSGENGNGKTVKTSTAKKGRSKEMRKVVGEIVILNVKEKAATAVITRTTQEVRTGDIVELQ